MIKAIESELYKISKNDDYNDDVYTVEIKETGNYIIIFKEELNELIELLIKSKYIWKEKEILSKFL
ncbi:MAG: hypothetical protein IJ094_10780 [Bacilli bacterium]|nr:hypothetical protein [Bacilli bacterium]